MARRLAYHSGSSPRMRGAQAESSRESETPRIIPADAGSTSPTDASLDTSRDHPRGCGEHSTPGGDTTAIVGSSPRMRGAHTLCRNQFG